MTTEDVRDNAAQLYGPHGGPAEPEPKPEVPAEEVPPPKLRPCGDLVLIRRLKADERTTGGIILPTSMRKDFFRAEVLVMGEGHWDYGALVPPADCVAGDIVLVQDERVMPNGVTHKHLIPVTPDDKQFLLCPGQMLYAIETRDNDDES